MRRTVPGYDMMQIPTPIAPFKRYERARLALFTFLFSINFEMINLLGSGDEGLSVSRITALLYVFTLMATVPLTVPRQARFPLLLLVVMYLLFTVLSIFNAMGSYDRIFDFSNVSCVLIFFFLVSHQQADPEVVSDGMIYFAIGAVIISVLGLYGFGSAYDSDGRLTIFGDNENVVGIRMAIASMVLIHRALQPNQPGGWRRVALAGMSLLTVAFMIETGSRVAALALLGSMFVLYARQVVLGGNFRFGSILVGALLVGAAPYLLLSENSPLIDRLQRSYYEGDLAGRQGIWGAYLGRLGGSDQLILGSGYSGFDQLATFLFGGSASPHNVLVEVLIIGGVLGLTVFLLFNLLSIVGSVRQQLQADRILPLMMLAPYVGSTLSAQTLNVKIMWVMLSLSYAPLVVRAVAPSVRHASRPLPSTRPA